ncbi:MAG: class D sortase [Streptococcaceae bacterium]|jgi:sortase A|nr:class D sortase [Streptococcaceae bacterium]
MSGLKGKVRYIYIPLIFMIIGYGTVWIIGKQQIDFAVSATSLLLLNDAPKTAGKMLYKSEVAKIDDEIPSSSITYPKEEDQFGEVVAEKQSLSIPLFYGDSVDILEKGAGMSSSGCFPGQFGTVLIGGHNRPEFGKIMKLANDEIFFIKTNYGTFLYKVLEFDIIKHDDNARIANELNKKNVRRVLLYTCYPLEAVGWANDRYIVIGEQIGGPKIDVTK